MKRIFSAFPPGPVIVIGSDIPEIAPDSVYEAFRSLEGADAVFGPSPDGGYWLIGLKRLRKHPPTLFRGVRWSTEHALADSVDTMPGWKIAYAECLADIDRVSDFKKVKKASSFSANWI